MSTTLTRNSRGLVDALFDTIDALNEKKITPEQARAVSHSARTIVAIAALEIEYERLNDEKGGKAAKLKSLDIPSTAAVANSG